MNVGRQYTDQKHNACLHVCMYACFIIIETLEKMNELGKKKKKLKEKKTVEKKHSTGKQFSLI